MSQLFSSGGQSIGSFSFSISPSKEHPGLIPYSSPIPNLYERLNYHVSIFEGAAAAVAAAAAKSLQLCPTLCDPIDSSPPGSSVPGILQARTLVNLFFQAVSFSLSVGITL